MKVLVYVDAENLSPVEVTSTLQDLKSSLRGTCWKVLWCIEEHYRCDVGLLS